MEYITSRSNPLCTHIRKLNASASYRRTQGIFVGEGGKLLTEALKWGKVIVIVRASGYPLPADLSPEIRQVEVPADLLTTLSDTQTPQGVLFLAELPQTTLPDTLEGNRYLVLDGVQDPGNLGTIWRTADAFGWGLLLLEGCADPFAPKTLRSTMGAAFRTPLWRTSWEELAPKIQKANLPLYATALTQESQSLQEVNLARSVVVIGSEGRGVGEQTLSHCPQTLLIPMAPSCESLNAAVAAGVVMFWGSR